LREGENEIAEAASFVRQIHLADATFIVDLSVEGSIPRCMQELVRHYTYARLQSGDPSVLTVSREKDFYLAYNADSIYASNNLFLISSAANIQTDARIPGLQPMRIGKYIALYTVDPSQKAMARQGLNDLYVIK
jgi:hypothetical protein